jgi:hypothetical protein
MHTKPTHEKQNFNCFFIHTSTTQEKYIQCIPVQQLYEGSQHRKKNTLQHRKKKSQHQKQNTFNAYHYNSFTKVRNIVVFTLSLSLSLSVSLSLSLTSTTALRRFATSLSSRTTPLLSVISEYLSKPLFTPVCEKSE